VEPRPSPRGKATIARQRPFVPSRPRSSLALGKTQRQRPTAHTAASTRAEYRTPQKPRPSTSRRQPCCLPSVTTGDKCISSKPGTARMWRCRRADASADSSTWCPTLWLETATTRALVDAARGCGQSSIGGTASASRLRGCAHSRRQHSSASPSRCSVLHRLIGKTMPAAGSPCRLADDWRLPSQSFCEPPPGAMDTVPPAVSADHMHGCALCAAVRAVVLSRPAVARQGAGCGCRGKCTAAVQYTTASSPMRPRHCTDAVAPTGVDAPMHACPRRSTLEVVTPPYGVLYRVAWTTWSACLPGSGARTWTQSRRTSWRKLILLMFFACSAGCRVRGAALGARGALTSPWTSPCTPCWSSAS